MNPQLFLSLSFLPFRAILQPAAVLLSRLRIGRQKRNGVTSFRFCILPGKERQLSGRKETLPGTRYSQFVFRNNTVCSGKQRGFPVIYRQSDEARQTKPQLFLSSHFSPFLGDRPARSRSSPGGESDDKSGTALYVVPLLALLEMVKDQLSRSSSGTVSSGADSSKDSRTPSWVSSICSGVKPR